jgi:serine/threonine protein kinase
MEPLSANDPHAVGEFQLRARLGAGGMGRVYLGFSPAGRAVAVKVVHPDLARDPEFRQRFAREVAAARAVSGVYTAPVVAAGLDDDPPWLATAYVPGPSLADVVTRHGPLAEPAVWRLAAGLAEALVAVHACGVVHRDLKPANVLLAADGPHVIDFGISRAFEGTSVTAAGMVVGTPGYMSPEQAEGVMAGPASDVFSLGCVLAYAATGNAPFGGGSAASVLYRVVTGQPDLTGVPGGLRDVIAACMMKNPAQRPTLAALVTMIAQAGPAVTATLTSFWPAPLAEIIRAAQAYPTPTQVSQSRSGAARPSMGQSSPGPASVAAPGMIQDGYYAAATASMAAQRPDAPTVSGPAGPAAGAQPASQPPSWPQTAPSGAGQQPWTPGQQPWTPGQQPWTPGQRPPAPDALSAYTPAPQRPWRPSSVLAATWLMYSGAAMSLLYLIIGAVTIVRWDHIAETFPGTLAAKTAHTMAGVAGVYVGLTSVLGIVCWIALAVLCGSGRAWARIAGTVLFALGSLTSLIVLHGTRGDPGVRAMDAVVWCIGLAVVVLLWQRKSSEYFAARR